MSQLNKGSWRTKIEPFKRRSSVQISDDNIYNFSKFGEINSNKILSPSNENKNEKINDSLNENSPIDYEKKNKAKKCLLYLLNIKSNGKFCPEIVDYFKKLKDSKIKEEYEGIKETHQEILNKFINTQSIKVEEQNNHKKYENDDKSGNQVIEKQEELNLINNNNINNYNNNKMDDEPKQNVIINIIDENGKMDKQNESNIDIKDIKSINIDDKELVKIDNIENTENIENKINYDKDFQLNKIINEEYKNENKHSTLNLNEKKNKKNSKKKLIKKRNKIDTIYNLQRSEFQKYGNYHSSLKSAIQSNLAKNKFHKKK